LRAAVALAGSGGQCGQRNTSVVDGVNRLSTDGSEERGVDGRACNGHSIPTTN
jgi:hypothetical protein